MNCRICGASLPQGARFCSNCGASTAGQTPGSPKVPSTEPAGPIDSTVYVQPQQIASSAWTPIQQTTPEPWQQPQQTPIHGSQAGPPMSPFPPPAPLVQYENNTILDRGAIMPPTANSRETRPRRRRNPVGCIISGLIVLVILLIIIGVGWVFVLRPYLHNMVVNQIDAALTSGVQQIPDTLPSLPIGNIPVPVMDTTINNLLVLNLAPNNPIKNPDTQITSAGITINFQVYGFSNGVSMKPQLQNGNLAATNVGISGPISLIMSPDELTPLLNRHLTDAQKRLKHPIQDVQLKDHEMDLVLGGTTTP